MTSTGPTDPSPTGPFPNGTTGRAGFPLQKRVLTALAAVSILGAAGCAGAEVEPPAAEAQTAENPAQETAPAAPEATAAESAAAGDPGAPEAAAADQTYEDGTYTQTGSYQSPAGPEEVGVTLTLEADVVTAVEVEPMPGNPTTKVYQGRFAGGISDAIVGKRLDDLTVDKVAGSSLTSGGFNDATGKIKSEAQL